MSAGARPSADRRRAWSGKDDAGAVAGARRRRVVSPPAVHQRHAAFRCAGSYGVQRANGRI